MSIRVNFTLGKFHVIRVNVNKMRIHYRVNRAAFNLKLLPNRYFHRPCGVFLWGESSVDDEAGSPLILQSEIPWQFQAFPWPCSKHSTPKFGFLPGIFFQGMGKICQYAIFYFCVNSSIAFVPNFFLRGDRTGEGEKLLQVALLSSCGRKTEVASFFVKPRLRRLGGPTLERKIMVWKCNICFEMNFTDLSRELNSNIPWSMETFCDHSLTFSDFLKIP